MRFFNTAGSVDSARHYCLSPLERLDLARVLMLIDQHKYFVLHAPRQTGNTLIAVLRQICTSYPRRPGQFPQSEVLCGVREGIAPVPRKRIW